jgi:Ca2+-binding RTX toxin-like protein
MDRALVSFESLEGRKLLSATLENGVLTVTGTRHGDKMEISVDHEDPTKLDVRVNDDTSSFSLADITGGVIMNGGNGSDKMAVNEVDGAVNLNVTMNGGNGRDLMLGGSENDTFNGDNGNDKLDGDGGNDTLSGGNGKDNLLGGAGDDELMGNRGNDKLDGGEGNDDLDGGKGNDRCFGRKGNDDFSKHDNKGELQDHVKSDDGDNENHDFMDDHKSKKAAEHEQEHEQEQNKDQNQEQEHEGSDLPESK